VSILEPLRAKCWWEPKLAPVLGTIYATAVLSRIPFSSLWPVLALTLGALSVCASYVSVLNDLTDAKDDRASGKISRQPGASRIYPATILASCIAVGLAFLIVWRNDTLLFCTYLLSWIAFALYSLPPFRLKARGIWGLLADASGAHLFPTLFGVLLLYHWTRMQPLEPWMLLIAVWSFAAGIRGILWHQFGDVPNDRRIGLRTFACLHPLAGKRLAILALLVELAALAAMLWLTRTALGALFLVLFGAFALLRRRLLDIRLGIVESRPNTRLALTEYYIVLYPLSYLLAASWQQPGATWLLLLHTVLFPSTWLRLVQELLAMLRISYRDPSRYRESASRQNPVVSSSEPQASFLD